MFGIITIVNHPEFSGYPLWFRPGRIFEDVACYIEEFKKKQAGPVIKAAVLPFSEAVDSNGIFDHTEGLLRERPLHVIRIARQKNY